MQGVGWSRPTQKVEEPFIIGIPGKQAMLLIILSMPIAENEQQESRQFG